MHLHVRDFFHRAQRVVSCVVSIPRFVRLQGRLVSSWRVAPARKPTDLRDPLPNLLRLGRSPFIRPPNPRPTPSRDAQPSRHSSAASRPASSSPRPAKRTTRSTDTCRIPASSTRRGNRPPAPFAYSSTPIRPGRSTHWPRRSSRGPRAPESGRFSIGCSPLNLPRLDATSLARSARSTWPPL